MKQSEKFRLNRILVGRLGNRLSNLEDKTTSTAGRMLTLASLNSFERNEELASRLEVMTISLSRLRQSQAKALVDLLNESIAWDGRPNYGLLDLVKTSKEIDRMEGVLKSLDAGISACSKMREKSLMNAASTIPA